MVGHKSNIDQEISHYPLQAHSESLLLTRIYSGDLRVYPLRIRNSFPTPANAQGCGEAEGTRQVRRIRPAHSETCVVSLGEGKRIKERRVGGSYGGKYIRNVGCDLILNDLECVGFRYWLRKPSVHVCVCVCVCVCMHNWYRD